MTNINFIVTEFLVGVCMTSCPRCSSNAKLTGKEWKYGHSMLSSMNVSDTKMWLWSITETANHTIPKLNSA